MDLGRLGIPRHPRIAMLMRGFCGDSSATTFQEPRAVCIKPQRPLPNKRLKLAGGDRSKGNGVFAPWQARTFVHVSCAGGRVARSLSAGR